MRYRLLVVTVLLFASIGCEDKKLAYMKERDAAIDRKEERERRDKEEERLDKKMEDDLRKLNEENFGRKPEFNVRVLP